MARRKKFPQPFYGEKTALVSFRIPVSLHTEIGTRAKRERVSTSRKIVQLLTDAVGDAATIERPAAPEESVFE